MARGIFGLIVAKAPPWSRKDYVLKRPPSWAGARENLSGPQLKACLALARAATGAFGTRGKTSYKGVSMPSVAVKVAGAVPKGEGVHGGRTADQRRTDAHNNAGISIASLETLLAAKGG